MERIVYDRMAAIDTRHWWYRARRDVLAALIERRIAPPPGARILEVGCGTGHNLAMLGRFGSVDAIEIDPVARGVASERLGRPVWSSPLPDLTGIGGDYNMIASLDVVEHVEDDRAALKAMAERLVPGGRLLITVPAHPWMWSAHDEVNHHHRRYTRASLAAAIRDAGLTLEMMSPFNSLLFPLAAASRIAGRISGKQDSDDTLPPAPINTLFERIFALERHAIGRVPFTPGVSLVAIISSGV
jgi:SAM-dependent methyltransferase